jgi:hypothetical protein
MTGSRLLVLHLFSPLEYAIQEEATPRSVAEISPEDADLLFAYPEESIPRGPLDQAGPDREKAPAALYAAAAVEGGRGGRGRVEVPAGDYFFCQWTAEHYPDVLDGLEAFAEAVQAEARAGGASTKGPWMLRVLAEDGGRRFQGLKAISA